MNEFYKDYSEYLAEVFPGLKVQKISVNSGASCPNRDGSIGRGGCLYCDNAAFSPSYCLRGGPVSEQVEAGRRFFARKYLSMKYMPYFQSFTTTHGRDAAQLDALWQEAVAQPDVVGLVVGTRPDCFPPEVAESLARVARRLPVFVEFGAESSCDATLSRVNRGHSWGDVCGAVDRALSSGLHVGLHLIAGLPGEREEDVLRSVSDACSLGIGSIKLHHLQVLRSSPLFSLWERGDFDILFPDVDKYLDFCVKVIDVVPRSVAIERFLASSPPAMVAAPRWGLKNYEFTARLMSRLATR